MTSFKRCISGYNVEKSSKGRIRQRGMETNRAHLSGLAVIVVAWSRVVVRAQGEEERDLRCTLYVEPSEFVDGLSR